MKQFLLECEELKSIITKAYESAPTLDEAERNAARFLAAQMSTASELRKIDLDARMKKSGLKAIKAAVYMENATKTDKKPSDVLLQAIVDQDSTVDQTQGVFDIAEVDRDLLQN